MQGLLRSGTITLRRPALHGCIRSLATRAPFVPPAQLEDVKSETPRRRREEEDEREAPKSPSFYSGRVSYYDQYSHIEGAVEHTRSALKMLQLLPLPDFARASIPKRPSIWKGAREMSEDLGMAMTSTRYRALTRLLTKLNGYYAVAKAAGCDELATRTKNLLNVFESSTKESNLYRGKGKVVHVDHLGRSYSFGKRKTSTARVWMVPTAKPVDKLETIDVEKVGSLDEAAGLLASQPERFQQPQLVPKSNILINNIPIGEYFPVPGDRERVVRPLQVAGVLGAYNIFTLVRGGGSTGQSGALAHGIAKGIKIHQPNLTHLLQSTKLLRRDPRMVERKKTGRAKARKGYTWVKR
ncbi:unnamed protein product [Mycena citricolor]|uniref:Uncharacterized protein n=1 Tax=Mycena citricolor TaxID=2018698 RepID=A0AAD2K6H9_9AGAR|nr:unnamed protein product [Mycena citricolor]